MYEGRSSEYFYEFFDKKTNELVLSGTVSGGNKTDCQKFALLDLWAWNSKNGNPYKKTDDLMIGGALKLKMKKITDIKDISKLKVRRIDAGMSQAELASASGVNLRMIQFYEQGSKDIRKAAVETVIALSDALGCDVKDII